MLCEQISRRSANKGLQSGLVGSKSLVDCRTKVIMTRKRRVEPHQILFQHFWIESLMISVRSLAQMSATATRR